MSCSGVGRRPACGDIASLVLAMSPFVNGATFSPRYGEDTDTMDELDVQKLMRAKEILIALHGVDSSMSFKLTDLQGALAQICSEKGGFDLGNDSNQWVEVQGKKLRTMCRHLGKSLRAQPPPKWVATLLAAEEGGAAANDGESVAAAGGDSASAADEPIITTADCDSAAAASESYTHGFDTLTCRAWRCGRNNKKEFTDNIIVGEDEDAYIAADWGDGLQELPDCTVKKCRAASAPRPQRATPIVWSGRHDKTALELSLRRKYDKKMEF